MSTSSRRLLQLLSIAALVAGAGCGPFGYLKKVAKDASKSVADAKAAEAEVYAPYEYWGAVSYLEQAKVLMAYSEYERSFDYGVRAKQLADEAKAKADKRESGEIKEKVSLPGSEDTTDGAAQGAASGEVSGGGSKGGGKAEGKLEVGVGGGK